MSRAHATALLLVLLLPALPGCVSSSDDPVPSAGSAGNTDAGSPADARDGDAGFAVDPEEPLDTAAYPRSCAAGVIDTATGLDYRELTPGGPIPIGGTGQAGLTARMALRMQGEADPGEVLVEMLLTNVLDGTDGDSKLAERPVRLACRDDGFCDLAPVLVEISHLAKLPELEGLTIRVDAAVREAADPERVLCRARNHGVLQRF